MSDDPLTIDPPEVDDREVEEARFMQLYRQQFSNEALMQPQATDATDAVPEAAEGAAEEAAAEAGADAEAEAEMDVEADEEPEAEEDAEAEPEPEEQIAETLEQWTNLLEAARVTTMNFVQAHAMMRRVFQATVEAHAAARAVPQQPPPPPPPPPPPRRRSGERPPHYVGEPRRMLMGRAIGLRMVLGPRGWQPDNGMEDGEGENSGWDFEWINREIQAHDATRNGRVIRQPPLRHYSRNRRQAGRRSGRRSRRRIGRRPHRAFGAHRAFIYIGRPRLMVGRRAMALGQRGWRPAGPNVAANAGYDYRTRR